MEPMVREQRIDIIRGIAMLIILINHLTQAIKFYGLDGWEIPTPTKYSYSSAAELFVIMSGYMVGLVYLSKPGATGKVISRAGKLYGYNIVLLIAVAAFIPWLAAEEAVFWRFDPLSESPLVSAASFAALIYAPRLLDILQLYIILLLATPLAISLYRRSPLRLAVASVVTYLITEVGVTFYPFDLPLVHWHFNPFAWQVLFFVPMALGVSRLHTKLFTLIDGDRRIPIAVLVLVMLTLVSRSFQLDHLLPVRWAWTSRDNLGPLRLVHALLMVVFYASALSLVSPLLQRWPFQRLASIGRNSLNMFGLSVFTTYALALLWDRLLGTYTGYLAMAAFSILLTIVTAALLDRKKRRDEGHKSSASITNRV
jgi:hypothetical protein